MADFFGFNSFFNSTSKTTGDRVLTDKYVYIYDASSNSFEKIKLSMDIETKPSTDFNLNSGGDVNISTTNKINLSGNTDVSGNTTISGTADISGDTTISGTADISGLLTLGDDLILLDDTNIGNTSNGSLLQLKSGEFDVNENTVISGTANISGLLTLGNNLILLDDANIGNTSNGSLLQLKSGELDINGNTTISGTADISGLLTLGDNLILPNDANIGNTSNGNLLQLKSSELDVNGNLSCYDLDNNGILILDVSSGDIEFIIKKPIMCSLHLDNYGFQFYSNGNYHDITALNITNNNDWNYGIPLNPGRYKFYYFASGGVQLYCTGVYGSNSIVVSEIIEIL